MRGHSLLYPLGPTDFDEPKNRAMLFEVPLRVVMEFEDLVLLIPLGRDQDIGRVSQDRAA